MALVDEGKLKKARLNQMYFFARFKEYAVKRLPTLSSLEGKFASFVGFLCINERTNIKQNPVEKVGVAFRVCHNVCVPPSPTAAEFAESFFMCTITGCGVRPVASCFGLRHDRIGPNNRVCIWRLPTAERKKELLKS